MPAGDMSRDLLFVSTRFLFPVDSGGKIRTTQTLKGLKGGAFRVVLLCPATAEQVEEWREEIEAVCDEFHWWPEAERGPLFHYTRMRYLPGRLPIPVRTDRQQAGVRLVERHLQKNPAVAVFDFAHAAVLAPASIPVPSVMFTHNVEAEIFRRHRDVAGNPLLRAIWSNQYRKMYEFEKREFRRFDVVVAVADRDAAQFARDYGIDDSFVIPTGVDLEFFNFVEPSRARDVVFCGSMDWLANQEAMRYFMTDVWPHVVAEVPDARMTVVGRKPPSSLIDAAKQRGLNWTFTGFVDDVRPHVHGAAVSVLPLRVGGGTRLKVYEAMAVGTPLVSTAIGVEGLPVEAGQHYVLADEPEEMGREIAALLNDPSRQLAIARAARDLVEANYSYRVAAKAFETACELAISRADSARRKGSA